MTADVLGVPGVPEHTHCEMCQRPIPPGNRLCGRLECADRHAAQVKEKKKQVYMLVLVIAGAVALSYILRGG